jgi:hypothetical protein
VNRIEKISILLGDVALPLMGYFFWDWNLYFILLFFMLDQLARVVFLHWRMKLTELNTIEKRNQILKAVFLFLSEVIIIHTVIFFQNPSIHFLEEFLRFFHYKDMGIEQGYLLFPLVFFGEWMRINNELKLIKEINTLYKMMGSLFRCLFLKIPFNLEILKKAIIKSLNS